jgi:hypothetical protein
LQVIWLLEALEFYIMFLLSLKKEWPPVDEKIYWYL